MKKLVYLVALLGVTPGSFAFLPKEGEPTGYMMVIGTVQAKNLSTKLFPHITTVAPDGQLTEENFSEEGFKSLRVAELQKINKLKQEGWSVISCTHEAGNPQHFLSAQMVYVLEKR